MRLPQELLHYTYEDLSDQLRTLNRFSSESAEVLFKRGKRATIFDLIFSPPMRFVKFYIVKKGFLEGVPGFIVALMDAFYALLKYGKLWEIGRKEL